MLELRRYLFPLVIGLSIIISVGIIAWQSGHVERTGTLGDTLGGIFSPILGLVSVILIYETFKSQREQLRDQQAANIQSKSSFFYGELKQLFAIDQEQINMFSFVTPSPNVLQFNNLEAVQKFITYYQRDPAKRISSSGLQLILLIILQLKQTLYIAQKSSIQSGLLTDDNHRSLMVNYLSGLISSQTQSYEPVFDILRDRLNYVRQKKLVEKPAEELNKLINYFQTYYTIMIELEKLGHINKYIPTNLNFQEFYDNPLNESELDSLNLLNTQYWTLKKNRRIGTLRRLVSCASSQSTKCAILTNSLTTTE